MVERYQQSLKGHLSKSLEDSRDERRMIVKPQLKRSQSRMIIPTELEASPVIFLQSLAAFCLHLENLPQAQFKGNGYISLAGDISRQPTMMQGYHAKDEWVRNTE